MNEEPHVITALIDLMRRHGTQCLVQVGCEDAHEAECIREATRCRVVGIDADPKCEAASPRVEFHRALIGATDCVGMTFYVNTVVGLSTPYVRRDGHGQEIRHYPQWRLDTFCREHDMTPDALIIDCEGATLDVLKGCGEMLQHVNVVYAEVSHDQSRGDNALDADVDAYMTERGFRRSMELPTYRAGAQSNWTYMR